MLRAELRGSGIRVKVVLPSTIDTPIYQHAANVTRRAVHPMPPASSPARVARAIVRAPARRRFATSVGLLQRVIVPLHRASPGAYDSLTRFMKKRIELRGDAPLSDGIVFHAPAEASPVTGGWRWRTGRLLVWGAGVLLVTAGAARRRAAIRG